MLRGSCEVQTARRHLSCGTPEARKTRACQSDLYRDTAYDVETAAKSDICTIGLLCGGGTEEELQRAGCVALYQDPADLLAHMAGRFWASRGQQKLVLTEKPA